MTRREALKKIAWIAAIPVVGGGLLAAAWTRSDAGCSVKVLADKCVGCDRCVRIAPHTFRMNASTGKAEVINPAGDPADKIKQAASECPTQAIVC